MATVTTPSGDIFEETNDQALAYYVGERYRVERDGVELTLNDRGQLVEVEDISATEPVTLDLSKPPADVVAPVVDGPASDAVAAPGALPEPTNLI